MSLRIQTLSIATVMLLLVAACSKEKKIAKQLRGTWDVTEVTIDITADGTDSTATGTPGDVSITFNKDETGSSSGADQAASSSFFPSNFTWTNTEEKLTVTDTETSFGVAYDIIEQSKTKLIIFFSYTETVATVVTKTDVTYTLTKQ